ncbi:hypothetical protein A4X13_0g4068 [Tilletia indica]|uniref:Uncharacterized protein n=1 Tax=Tilletia indica TaxID=43049 RepID=A0A8T8SYT4_9BASI|nr:hypothetical protein A4X13_0g4068 [Tilletia indica]
MAFLLNTLFNIRLLFVSGHAVSRDDSDDKAKDDLVRQAAARQRTVTPRRHMMRRHGGRLGIDKAERVVTQGTAPQDTPDKRGGPAVTSARQDEDGDGCGERRYLPQSVRQDDGWRHHSKDQAVRRRGRMDGIDARTRSRSATRRDDLRLTRQGPRLRCRDGQTDGDGSRSLTSQGSDETRDRADSDSDGKTQDAGRRTTGSPSRTNDNGKGRQGSLPRTGAARRRSKTPTSTVRTGQQDVGTIRSRRRTAGQVQWFKTCNRTGTAQTVRRGGKTAFSYLVDNAKDQCGGTKVRSLRRRLQPVRQDYGSYGSGATRRILTSRGEFDSTDIISFSFPYRAGANRARSARSRRGRSLQPMRQYENPEELSSVGSRPAGSRERHSPTQKVRRGGEMTAGDLTAAKAKPPQTENGGRRYEGQSQGRSARNQVRDVLETAWPVRPDEDAGQLSGRWTVNDLRTQRYKRQGVNTEGKARETTVTAQRAGAARRSTTRSGTGRWQLRRPSVAAPRRGIENGKTNVNRPKDLKVTGIGLSDSEGKAQDDSVKDMGGRHLRTTGTAQTVRRGGKTTAGDLTAKAKVSTIETQRRLYFTFSRSINPTDTFLPASLPSWIGAGEPRSATHRGDLGLTRQGPRLRCGDGQTDGDESRSLTSQEADVPRDRADNDSDGKTQDAGRRTQDAGRRTQDAGRRTQDAGRRTTRTPSRTDDDGKGRQGPLPLDWSGTTTVDDTHVDGAGPVVQDLQLNGNGTEGPSRRRDDDRRPPSKGQGLERRDQGPPPTETACGWCSKAQGDDTGTERRTMTGQGCWLLTSQGTGPTATRKARAGRRHGERVRSKRSLGRQRRRATRSRRRAGKTLGPQDPGDGTDGPLMRQDDG